MAARLFQIQEMMRRQAASGVPRNEVVTSLWSHLEHALQRVIQCGTTPLLAATGATSRSLFNLLASRHLSHEINERYQGASGNNSETMHIGHDSI